MVGPKPIGLSSIPASAPTPIPVQVTIDQVQSALTGAMQTLQPAVQQYSSPVVQSPLSQGVILTMDDADKAGASTQMAIADATKKITSIAKTSDMDELGKLLSETLLKAKGYDPSGLAKDGGFFKNLFGKVVSLRQRFDKVDDSVNALVSQIDQRVSLFKSRITDLGAISTQNRSYHDALTSEIVRLVDGVVYMEANPPVVDMSDTFSAQKAQEWNAITAWARKRADDLRRAQIVAQQQDAQINLMQQNSRALAQKFTDLKVTTLPLLQQTFTLYIINMEQAKGAEMANSIDDLSDATMQKNAAALGQNTVAIQTSLNRSNFSLKAITANHDAVIKALDDIERIRAETKTRLATEAPLLEQASRDLAARLAQRPTS